MGTRQIAGITEMMSRDPLLEGLYNLAYVCCQSISVWGLPLLATALEGALRGTQGWPCPSEFLSCTEMRPCTRNNRLLHALFLAVVAVHAIGIQTRTLEIGLEISVVGVHVNKEFTENCCRQKCLLWQQIAGRSKVIVSKKKKKTGHRILYFMSRCGREQLLCIRWKKVLMRVDQFSVPLLPPVLLEAILCGALAGTIEFGEAFGRAENPRSQKTWAA